MSGECRTYDLIVIGSGPGGMKAAVHAANSGRSVLLIEKERDVGGACVQHGTIPSKTLRETAVAMTGFRRRSGDVFQATLREDMQVASLMTRLEQVIKAHQGFMTRQVSVAGVELVHGRASFVSPHEVRVERVRAPTLSARGTVIVIATGSRPRKPDDIPIDHAQVLDSDSILSMTYLPTSLAVLGSGVIACEYASVFAALGVEVTVIDKYPGPLGFLDHELTDQWVQSFEASNGTFVGNETVRCVEWDGVSTVVTTLESGREIRTEKLLFALGRVANVEGLNIAAAGLAPNQRGLIDADMYGRTAVPHIYAVGDVIGPPSLAASSMQQGRHAVCHAFGIDTAFGTDIIPAGIYTIPEMSCIGLTEAQARQKHGDVIVGRAPFAELARGQISANEDGFLKLVADAVGREILGIHIIGEGAAELIHVGQMAMRSGQGVEVFLETIFNFPTLAEAYRVAALEVAHQARQRCQEPLPVA